MTANGAKTAMMASAQTNAPHTLLPAGAPSQSDRIASTYNVVRWGRTELPPEAGVAVYVRGQSGRLAAARIYDDADPPLGVAA